MTTELDNMTQAEFDELMVNVKTKYPKLFQIIKDFVDKKLSLKDVERILSMSNEEQINFINNYKTGGIA